MISAARRSWNSKSKKEAGDKTDDYASPSTARAGRRVPADRQFRLYDHSAIRSGSWMTFLQIRIRLRSNIEVLPAFSAIAQQEYPPQKFLTPESIIGIRGFFRVKENLCV
jgi:hypothetical protein